MAYPVINAGKVCHIELVYANQALTQLTGIDVSSLLGKAVQDQDFPKPIKDATEVLRQALLTGAPGLFESEIVDADGTVKHYHTSVVPEFGTLGEVETILTISRNISALSCVVSEGSLFATASTFIIETDNQGVIPFSCLNASHYTPPRLPLEFQNG
ncbi:MAG: PAS domain-containing protein [Proteobacteria bacterium]|nr:PAS domain-containing protein [Pseudomonadota bacterium]